VTVEIESVGLGEMLAWPDLGRGSRIQWLLAHTASVMCRSNLGRMFLIGLLGISVRNPELIKEFRI
jgi:hypothetical protein